MSTFVTHMFAGEPRSKKTPLAHTGDAHLEATLSFRADAIMIAVKDTGISEELSLVAELELVLESGQLTLRAMTNEQLTLDLDGVPEVQLYDVDDPFPKGEEGA